MRRTSFLFCLPVLGCSFLLFGVPHGPGVVEAADKKPAAKEAPKPSVDAHDLAEANKTLAGLSDSEYAALCGAYYLMRPSVEAKLFEGKARVLCPLEPLEKPASGELSTAEMLRLWALLDVGVPDSEPLQRTITRFLRTSPRGQGATLARQGVYMLTLCAVLKRLPASKADDYASTARAIIANAERHELCSNDSPHFASDGIRIGWYANQFWRSVINRCALGLGLKVNFKRWGNDLALLDKVYLADAGWTSRIGNAVSPYESVRLDEDLHANLLATAALSLAAEAPTADFSDANAKAISACAARAPFVLSRLISDFEGLQLNGARLLVLLAIKAAPAGKEDAAWRGSLLAAHAAEYRASGRLDAYSSMPECLGLKETQQEFGLGDVLEAAFGMVGVSGGLFRIDAGPLAARSHDDCVRLLWARTIKDAADAPDFSDIVAHPLPTAEPITEFMERGAKYLLTMQDAGGGWGSTFGGGRGKDPVQATTDPGTTAFCALALMRMGSTPLNGTYKDPLKRALEHMLNAVEQSPAEGPNVASATNTQPQRKLGPLIDTAMAAQFLARVIPKLASQPALQSRAERALDKCVRKIEQSQDEDGTWTKAGGWAPVLQSAMMNQALELAELCGRKVSKAVLEKSRSHYADDTKTTAPGRSRGGNAGIDLYSGSTAQRVSSKDVREAGNGIDYAVQLGRLSKGAAVNEANLIKAGFSRQEAKLKANAYARFETENKKLNDPAYLKGFGNNGGEEFISFMLCSESLVITGGDNWKKWTQQMHETYKGIQNADGGWSGHHCITSPVVCTAAVLLCLTADREVHVKVEPPPLSRKTLDRDTAPPETPRKKDGPVTGS